MAGPAPSTTTVLAVLVTALVALLCAPTSSASASSASASSASASHGAHQPRRQAQEDGGSSIFAAAGIESGGGTSGGLTVSSLLEVDAQCHDPLYQSDANGDGRIDRDEYAAFANALSGGYFADSACTQNNKGEVKKCDFDLLPLALQSNFINLACLCERFRFGGALDDESVNKSESDCCVGDNAHISTYSS